MAGDPDESNDSFFLLDEAGIRATRPCPSLSSMSRSPMLCTYIRSTWSVRSFWSESCERLLGLLRRVGPDLAGQEHSDRAVLQGHADRLFRLSVDVGGVDEIDAQFERFVNKLDHGRDVDLARLTAGPGPEGQDGDFLLRSCRARVAAALLGCLALRLGGSAAAFLHRRHRRLGGTVRRETAGW